MRSYLTALLFIGGGLFLMCSLMAAFAVKPPGWWTSAIWILPAFAAILLGAASRLAINRWRLYLAATVLSACGAAALAIAFPFLASASPEGQALDLHRVRAQFGDYSTGLPLLALICAAGGWLLWSGRRSTRDR